jgi:hypothetical protein
MKSTFIKILFFTIVTSLSTFAQSNFGIETKLSNNNYEEERTLTITIIKNKKELYSVIKNLLPYYSIPETIVFSDGNLALLYSLEGIIEFYDSTQNLIEKKEHLTTNLYDEHKILFSKTETKIAILISENSENKIIVYNSHGEKLHSLGLKKGIADGIVLSEEANKCALSLYSWQNNQLMPKSFIVDFDNEKQEKLPALFNKGFFNKGNNQFCGFTNKTFFKIDLLKNKIVLNKKIPKNKILIDVQSYNQNTYFIEANLPKLKNGIWEYQSAEVVKIDTNNKITVVKKITTPFTKINFDKPLDNTLNKTNSEEFILKIIR